MSTSEIDPQCWDRLASDDEAIALEARHEIVLNYQYLVEACARRLEARLPSWVSDDDLVSSGQIGLLRAIDRFDPSKGIPFSRFVSSAIHGAIIDDLRKQDWAPKQLRRNQREISKATSALSTDGERPSLEKIAQHLGWDQAKVESTLRKVDQADMVNATDISRDSSPESHSLDVQLVCRLFVREFQRLAPPVQVVLARIYLMNQTLPQVSTAMGLSTGVVRKLHMQGVRVAMDSVQGSLIG